MIPRTVRTIAFLSPLVPMSGAQAQERVMDRGWMEVRRVGEIIAREEFAVIRKRISDGTDGWEIRATAYYPAQGPVVVLRQLLELHLDSMPVGAQVDASGPVRRQVVARLGARRISYRVLVARKERAREMPGSRRRWVLHDSLISPYAVPATMISGPLDVFHLNTGTTEPARLEDLGPEETSIDGRSPTLRHLVLVVGGENRHLWFDSEGRLMKVQIPGRRIVAVRE